MFRVLKEAASHAVSLPLPIDGHGADWLYCTCVPVMMGQCADYEERCHCACSVGGGNARRPCPKCKSGGGALLLEPVETDPASTRVLSAHPRVPRRPADDNALIDQCAAAAELAGSATSAIETLRAEGLRGVPVITGVPGWCSLAGLLADGMHVLDEGLTKRFLVGAIALVCANLGPKDGTAVVRDLNDSLRACRLFPGPRGGIRLHPIALFYYSKEGGQILPQFTSAEMAASVAVLPFVFRCYPLLSKLFQAWAGMYNELRSPAPDWAGARRAYRLYQELLRAYANSGLDTVLTEGIDTPKAHDIVHLIGQRLALGAIDLHNLQQMENAHILWLKSAFKNTDMRKEGIESCIAAAVVKMQTNRLVRQLLGKHYSQSQSLSAPVLAKWREHAGDKETKCAALRGKGQHAGLPKKLKLGGLCALWLHSPVGHIALRELPDLIGAAMGVESGGPTLLPPHSEVLSSHSIRTYTACRVAGVGRQQCVKSWAHARPASSARSQPLFDFVAFAAVDDDTGAVVERVGLLLLIFTLRSVCEPLCLLKMLRQQPPQVAV